MRNLCGDTTLKHVVVVTQGWGQNDPSEPATSQRQLELATDDVENRVFKPAIENGAQVYHRVDESEPAQEVLRMILSGKQVVPEIQPAGFVDCGGQPVQTVPVRTPELSKEMRESVERHNAEIKEMREAMGREIETLQRQLDEQKTRAQEEAEGLRKCIAEMMRSKFDEDRHESGEVLDTHNIQPILPFESIFCGTAR